MPKPANHSRPESKKAVAGDELPVTTLLLTPCFSEHAVVDGNHARQLLVPEQTVRIEHAAADAKFRLSSGALVQLVRRKQVVSRSEALFVPPSVYLEHYERAADIEGCAWIGERRRTSTGEVIASLKDRFQFLEDRPAESRRGLRTPQVGALHSILGYWTTDPREPATVVMPTGTGKTETMIALYAQQAISRLLLVPSDALRTQIASKFETYGILQEMGVIDALASRPIVGQLKHGLAKKQSALAFAEHCNIVVTTPNALGVSHHAVQDLFLDQFTHLFVDEAHHLGAATWKAIRDRFSERRVIQFTATPFREDGEHLKGKIVYAFPLREAQRQEYFAPIDYISVLDGENPDRAIAQTAIQRLRQDVGKGFDHLIMARVDRIGRAEELVELYASLAPEFAPVVLHSKATATERAAGMAAVRSRSARVAVCVNMLGEGFDLPELKVAAIHDPHKSLGVTLQFIGRFARGHARLGRAAVVIGRPDAAYDNRLRALYREDADWNAVIRNLSEEAVRREEDVDDFERAFSKRADSISLQALAPKMSAVVYRTKIKDWRLSGIPVAFKEGEIFGDIVVNRTSHVAWFITRRIAPVGWGVAPELTQLSYELYVLYWDQTRQLLYVNSSNTDGHHEVLAKKVCGDAVEKVTGEHVYRVMADIARLVPSNVGVLDSRNYAHRFTMHAGSDVSEGFAPAAEANKFQTNIFASGFEGGTRVSIGASTKGRIWSHRIARSLKHWVTWCDHVGTKLLDDECNVDDIMRRFIRPTSLSSRPELVFLGAEWPWELFQSTSESVVVELNGSDWPMVDAELEVTTFGTNGNVGFDVVTPTWTASYEAKFTKRGIVYFAKGPDINVKSTHRATPLSEYLQELGLTFHLEKDALIVHPSLLLQPDRELPPFDSAGITALVWKGIDLRKESRGASKAADSIQARMIIEVDADASWRVILDDDGSGEIADVVALSATEHDLRVLLLHCKYSAESDPGARIEDLYEVCGQAQKSVRWRRDPTLMVDHLIRREKNRAKSRPSGLVRGDLRALYSIRDQAAGLRPTFEVAIAQPGLSKAKVSVPQLHLLASTETYLRETHLIKLKVFASP